MNRSLRNRICALLALALLAFALTACGKNSTNGSSEPTKPAEPTATEAPAEPSPTPTEEPATPTPTEGLSEQDIW